MKCIKCKSERGSGRKILDSFLIVSEEFIGDDYCVTCFHENKEKFKEKIVIAISTTSEKTTHEHVCPDCSFNVKTIIENFGKDEWSKKYLEHRMTHQEQENLGNEKQINSLYHFIKKISEEKGRKLKVICDWDETVHDRTSFAIYESSDKDTSFDKFFENFRIKVDREFDKKIEKIKKQELWNDFRDSPGFYQISPFLSNAQDLLRCLKNNLVDKLIFLTGTYDNKETHYELLRVGRDATSDQIKKAYEKIALEFNKVKQDGEVRKKRKGINISHQVLSNFNWRRLYDQHGDNWDKREKFQKTFGKFPQSSMFYAVYDPEKVSTYDWVKWEWMLKNHPDFDLFIDDDISLMDNRRIFYPNREDLHSDSNRYYVLPNYKNSKVVNGENVYYVKTSVSNLNDENFVANFSEVQVEQLALKSLTEKELEKIQKRSTTEMETESQFRELVILQEEQLEARIEFPSKQN